MNNNYIDFSLEVALKEPHRVVTRQLGKPKKWKYEPKKNPHHPIKVSVGHYEITLYENGQEFKNMTSPFDLFLLPKEEEQPK